MINKIKKILPNNIKYNLYKKLSSKSNILGDYLLGGTNG